MINSKPIKMIFLLKGWGGGGGVVGLRNKYEEKTPEMKTLLSS